MNTNDKFGLPKSAIPPTDQQNLPDQKSYDIFNLIEPKMISMYLTLDENQDVVLVSAPRL